MGSAEGPWGFFCSTADKPTLNSTLCQISLRRGQRLNIMVLGYHRIWTEMVWAMSRMTVRPRCLLNSTLCHIWLWRGRADKYLTLKLLSAEQRNVLYYWQTEEFTTLWRILFQEAILSRQYTSFGRRLGLLIGSWGIPKMGKSQAVLRIFFNILLINTH